jgi:Fic family protein
MDALRQRLDSLPLSPELVRLIADLEAFRGQWQALGGLAPERLRGLKRVATIESIGSSTRIEGARLTDAQVEALLSSLSMESFRSRDEEEVAGYARVMDLVFDSWRELALSANHVKQLHRELLHHSSKDERHRGQWKTLPNHLEAFDADGKSLGIVVDTVSPFDTPLEMERLLAQTTGELATRHHHPLLVIGAFIVRFLAIHPFQDGNGRLSRALTTLLLLREGYQFVPYASLERVIEENKDGYYRALRAAQTEPSRLGEWLGFFLRCLVSQKDVLARRVERERMLTQLSALEEQVLQLVRERGRLSLAEAMTLTRANRNTLKLAFRRLSRDGHVRLVGAGRGAHYQPAR